jgi:hypothetical protein
MWTYIRATPSRLDTGLDNVSHERAVTSPHVGPINIIGNKGLNLNDPYYCDKFYAAEEGRHAIRINFLAPVKRRAAR